MGAPPARACPRAPANARRADARRRAPRRRAPRRRRCPLTPFVSLPRSAPSPEWSYPPEADGWCRAHAVLRAQMAGWSAALQALAGQFAAGAPLDGAQRTALAKYWRAFTHFLHSHHANEDAIVGAYMAARGLALPTAMAADHAELVAQLAALDAAAAAMAAAPTAAAALAELRAAAPAFAAFRAACEAHFAAEEEVYVGVIRAGMTENEYRCEITAKIAAALPASEQGAFFRGAEPRGIPRVLPPGAHPGRRLRARAAAPRLAPPARGRAALEAAVARARARAGWLTVCFARPGALI